MDKPNLILCELRGHQAGDGRELLAVLPQGAPRAQGGAACPTSGATAAAPTASSRYNPTGQVPVLLVDGAPVADSTEILQQHRRAAPGRARRRRRGVAVGGIRRHRALRLRRRRALGRRAQLAAHARRLLRTAPGAGARARRAAPAQARHRHAWSRATSGAPAPSAAGRASRRSSTSSTRARPQRRLLVRRPRSPSPTWRCSRSSTACARR